MLEPRILPCKIPQIVVEILTSRNNRSNLDAYRLSTSGKLARGVSSGAIIVRGDDQATNAGRNFPRSKMRRRERRNHRHMRRDAFERENGFYSFADDRKFNDHAEANAIAENCAERAAWRSDTRLLIPIRIEKRSMNSPDLTAIVGDGGDKRRQFARRRISTLAIDQRRMVAQRRIAQISGDFSRAEISFGLCADNRLRRRPDFSRERDRVAFARTPIATLCRPRARRPQKAPRLVERVSKGYEPFSRADEVEEIAMFRGGGISLMCNCT